ncbi:hypothetical protein BJ741DRAFT_662183 [Chytriomyces cf. hyalinus JEL632]|nr:hypothetical protein BJ741DRAFT_662183 [Chytriomyces cf. hyalinus JEL632]
MKYASLQDNRLNAFPVSFGKWTSLTCISLSNSGLVGAIPDSIKHLRYLKELVLSCNRDSRFHYDGDDASTVTSIVIDEPPVELVLGDIPTDWNLPAWKI